MTTRVAGAEEVRTTLRAGAELALLDVRLEPEFAAGHPLWAASLPLDRLELEAYERLPRRDVPIVLIGRDEVEAEVAASRLQRLGYVDIRLLDGGIDGWSASGGELFIDVNVPSKAFGELVVSVCDTPSLAPDEVAELLRRDPDVVVVDVRRLDEYRTMSIPGAVSAPGGELVHRISVAAPDPRTLVVVNCAGRTRSIIGAQSLRNAGVVNRVASLRNGTIGWSLAGLELDHGRDTQVGRPSSIDLASAATSARSLARRTGVRFVRSDVLATLSTPDRTIYRFDVRDPAEYEEGHPEGFAPAPGGQLVQETDHFAPVRGALVVLAGDGTARAPMTASWLAQMGWEVVVVDDLLDPAASTGGLVGGPHRSTRPPLRPVPSVTVEALERLERPSLVDVAPSRAFGAGHLPGAHWSMRRDLWVLLDSLDPAYPVVVTSPDGAAAAFAVADVLDTGRPTHHLRYLEGGTAAWEQAGHELVPGTATVPDPAPDVYRRPYEGTSVDPATMQAYLDWEYGLVAQLDRDGTHRFAVWTGDVLRPS